MVKERLTFSNKGPASGDNAAKFESEMIRVFPYAKDNIKHTWDHEYYGHFKNDPESKGEFGYQMDLEIASDGMVFASWVAYYMPIGEREPEDMMDIAVGPGWVDMSEQDKKVYDASWRQWKEKLEEEKRDSLIERESEDDEASEHWRSIDKESIIHMIPTLVVVPRNDDESDKDYDDRLRWVRRFGEKVDEMIKEGKLEPAEGNITNYIVDNLDTLKKAYIEAGKVTVDDEKEDGEENPDIDNRDHTDSEDVSEENANGYGRERKDLDDSIIGGINTYWGLN